MTQLYRKVAKQIVTMVNTGSLRPGDQIPSIREMSRRSRVSINTVRLAYSHLEDRAVISARPQSGYYVAPRLPDLPREPIIRAEDLIPSRISPSELVIRIMKDVLNPEMVQFGAAIPDPALVPGASLSRLLASETRTHMRESIGYAMVPGNGRLRKQIAKRMIRGGCTLNPEQILITSGASEAVFLALQSLCSPGDTVAVSSPVYFNFVQMFNLLNLRVIEIPNSPTRGLHLKSLRRAIDRNSISCVLVVSNFDNPLGTSLTDESKQKLVEILAQEDIPLIEDDIYGDLGFKDDRPTVAKAWDHKGMVLLCSSFSKTLAPGYRVGWISPGKFWEELLHRKLTGSIASPSPSQLAIAAFLENGGYDHHLRSIRRAYSARVLQLADAIGSHFPVGTRVTRPTGGFTLWVELPEEIDTVELYLKALEAKITIAPGGLFSTTGKFRNCLRLNGAFWSEETRWAIDFLGKQAKELLKSRKISFQQ